MKLIKALAVSTVIFSNVTFAFAQTSIATMTLSSGKVLVNKGQGFKSVDGLVSLNAGDAIMVGKDSSASISYNNGCTMNVSTPSVVKVKSKAPCAVGQSVIDSQGTVVAPVADVVLPPVAAPFGSPGLLAAGLGLGVVGVIIVNSVSK